MGAGGKRAWVRGCVRGCAGACGRAWVRGCVRGCVCMNALLALSTEETMLGKFFFFSFVCTAVASSNLILNLKTWCHCL